jgi:UDP-glucose 4-epimerase
MRILITGGAGFVGSHLSDELLKRGHRVHVLDDLSTGAIDNIRHLKHHPSYGYTVDSCNNSSLVAELVDSADAVYHLAAAVGVELIVESPVRTIENNVHSTEVVLSAASKKKKPVFVASTSEVYGKSPALPFREDGDLLMGPTVKGRWSYACSKAIDEFLALAYWKERGLPTVIGRMFNTVGPRQTGRYGMVVPNFVRQALAGQPITVFGDGTQTRCFCHVHDVVRALADLMERDDLYGEVFNIGAEEEISIADLAARVREIVGNDVPITYVPYDEAYEEGFEDMHRRVPDISETSSAKAQGRTKLSALAA